MVETTAIDGTQALLTSHEDWFRQRGWITLRSIFSPEEMKGFRPVLRGYIADTQAKTPGALDAAPFASTGEHEPVPAAAGSNAYDARASKPAFSLADAPDEVAAFVKSPRLGELAARFLGVEAVRILHFAGFTKPCGAPPTPWHQDLSYIPLDTDRVLSIWIPLADITPEMAPLVFAEGSHLLRAPVAPQTIGGQFHVAQNGAMQAGDVSLHMGWTLHGALKNSGEHMREAFAICYYADGARIERREGGLFIQNILNNCFPGLAPGDPAFGPLNPVVYRRQDA
jgi:hypothetical protein